MKPRRKNVVRPTITLWMQGPQGSGKTRLLDTLREAGWEVSPECHILGRTVACIAMPPRRSASTRRKAGR